MSPEEIGWRLKGVATRCTDRVIAPWRESRRTFDHLVAQRTFTPTNALFAFDSEPSANPEHFASLLTEAQRARLIEQADRLLRGHFAFFDIDDLHVGGLDVGGQFDWNFDYSAKKRAPLCKASAIDYRDFEVAGDCKLVWEPNRHQHLVVLARAYAVTQKTEYAQAVLDHIDSWIKQCPFPNGMNWRSPLEFGVRLINWVAAFELIQSSGLLTQERWRELVPTIHRHLWCLDRGYSRYSSANNHLIGEAAGAYIGARYFDGFAESNRWANRAKQILEEEIVSQTHRDGGNKEQALGYQVFVLEFFLLSGLVGRHRGDAFSETYWDRIEAMFDYVAAFVEGGGQMPLYGDYDDGYVVDAGDRADQARGLLGVAGAIFSRDDFTQLAGDCTERVAWQFGRKVDAAANASSTLGSRAFEDTGYYLLQHGSASGQDNRISAVFDCAELGMGSLAAHGHADALSLTLRAFGYDVLVDPGTYDYFTHRKWRDYFKSTRAHNTITVDRQDQSEMLGLFLWGRRADSTCVDWSPSANGGSVSGKHTGYNRLGDPVGHQRTVELDGASGELVVTDELQAATNHAAEISFHFSERCHIERIVENSVNITAPFGRVLLAMDARLQIQTYCGSENPIAGWMSRGYHRKVPCPTVVGRLQWTGNTTLVTRISLQRQASNSLDHAESSRGESLPPQGGLGMREVSQRGA